RIARIEIATELGRDHQAVALRRVMADVVADDLLRVALGVEVRRVDEVATGCDEAVHDLLRFLDGRTPAEVFTERHRTQAQRADAQARTAERHVMIESHKSSPWYSWFRLRVVLSRRYLILN